MAEQRKNAFVVTVKTVRLYNNRMYNIRYYYFAKRENPLRKIEFCCTGEFKRIIIIVVRFPGGRRRGNDDRTWKKREEI